MTEEQRPFDVSYARDLEAYMDEEGGTTHSGNVRHLIEITKAYHLRGLELTKALTVCVEAMAPSDRGGISMHEWNQRLKAAQKHACAVLSNS